MSRTTTIAACAGITVAVALSIGGCKRVIDEDARRRFTATYRDSSITVVTTCIRLHWNNFEYDESSALRLADGLRSIGIKEVEYRDTRVSGFGDWRMNQAKMFRESVAAFQAYLTKHPVDTDYIILAEYLMGGPQREVIGIHAYVLQADGTPAFGVGLNSHHAIFNDIDPQTVEECDQAVLRALRAELGVTAPGI